MSYYPDELPVQYPPNWTRMANPRAGDKWTIRTNWDAYRTSTATVLSVRAGAVRWRTVMASGGTRIDLAPVEKYRRLARGTICYHSYSFYPSKR